MPSVVPPCSACGAELWHLRTYARRKTLSSDGGFPVGLKFVVRRVRLQANRGLGGVLAAVNNQVVSEQERGGRRSEKYDSLRDLLGAAETSGRDLFDP